VPEDIALCESVQRGLKSRSYRQGRFVFDEAHKGTSEHAVHHFHKRVLAAMQERTE
jgi:choline monooxygenase